MSSDLDLFPMQGSWHSAQQAVAQSTLIDVETLKDHFHLPITEVAKKLGVCATVLKKICRKNGISRWPHRKIKSLDKTIANLEATKSKNPQQHAKIQEELESAKMAKDQLVRNPNASSPQKNLKMRRRERLSYRSFEQSDESSIESMEEISSTSAASEHPGGSRRFSRASNRSSIDEGLSASVRATTMSSEYMASGRPATRHATSMRSASVSHPTASHSSTSHSQRTHSHTQPSRASFSAVPSSSFGRSGTPSTSTKGPSLPTPAPAKVPRISGLSKLSQPSPGVPNPSMQATQTSGSVNSASAANGVPTYNQMPQHMGFPIYPNPWAHPLPDGKPSGHFATPAGYNPMMVPFHMPNGPFYPFVNYMGMPAYNPAMVDPSRLPPGYFVGPQGVPRPMQAPCSAPIVSSPSSTPASPGNRATSGNVGSAFTPAKSGSRSASPTTTTASVGTTAAATGTEKSGRDLEELMKLAETASSNPTRSRETESLAASSSTTAATLPTPASTPTITTEVSSGKENAMDITEEEPNSAPSTARTESAGEPVSEDSSSPTSPMAHAGGESSPSQASSGQAGKLEAEPMMVV